MSQVEKEAYDHLQHNASGRSYTALEGKERGECQEDHAQAYSLAQNTDNSTYLTPRLDADADDVNLDI